MAKNQATSNETSGGAAVMDGPPAAGGPPSEHSAILDTRLVPLTQIDRGDDNHRITAAVDRQKIEELASTFRHGGGDSQLSAIRLYEKRWDKLSSPTPAQPYVLGFGFRRLAAAELAGWSHIRAEIYPPATPEEIHRARAIENLQRQDLNPLEECLAIEEMLATFVPDTTDNPATPEKLAEAEKRVAGALGKSLKWVKDRTALERLSKKCRAMLLAGTMSLGWARQFAKLADHAAQDQAVDGMDHLTGTPGGWELNRLNHYMHQLSRASWPLNLPIYGKPACDSCPHNSVNNPELFETVLEGKKGEPKPEPRCAMATCFQHKAKSAERQLDKVIKKIGNAKDVAAKSVKELVKLGTLPADVKPEAVIERAKANAQPSYQYKPPKPPTKDELARRAAIQKFEEAHGKWKAAAEDGVLKLAKQHPLRYAVLMLLEFQPRLDKWVNLYGKKGTPLTPDAMRLLDAAAAGDGAAVLALATAAANSKDAEIDYAIHGPILEHLAEKWGVKRGPEPKKEDFLAKVKTSTDAKGKKKSKTASAAGGAKATEKPRITGKRLTPLHPDAQKIQDDEQDDDSETSGGEA